MSLPCKWDVQIGKIIEFMDSQKGVRTLQYSIVGVIIVQVMSFLVMWGSLKTTVQIHDKSISAIMAKLDNVKIVGYVYSNEIKDARTP